MSRPEHDYALEADAIALALAGQVHNNEDAHCVETLAKQLVLTALLAAEQRGMERAAEIADERDANERDANEWEGTLVWPDGAEIASAIRSKIKEIEP